MLNLPERVTSVTHPLVSSIYVKTEYGNDSIPEDVLVIQTNFSQENEESEEFENHLTDLLSDLHDLQAYAEQKIGHFDRVDIRTN